MLSKLYTENILSGWYT